MGRPSSRRNLAIVLAAALAFAARADAGWPEAETAYAQQRWEEAARAFGDIVRANSRDAAAELRLATALIHLRRFDEATAHLERAKSLGSAGGAVAYRRAAVLAQKGERDAAFAELDAALAAGLAPALRPASDALLEPLRADPRFTAFLDRFDRAVTPCRHDARYRALDFWVGTWDVRARDAAPDSPASENVITLEHGDCVVAEHWRSLVGGTGTSVNIYDASRRVWTQTWVDSGGELHEYRGGPDEKGNMVFEGEVPGGAGQPARVPTRLTLFREGADRVRQFSQSSVDAGRTWTTNYDFIYTRRGQAR